MKFENYEHQDHKITYTLIDAAKHDQCTRNFHILTQKCPKETLVSQ